jgi:hypothetical protein
MSCGRTKSKAILVVSFFIVAQTFSLTNNIYAHMTNWLQPNNSAYTTKQNYLLIGCCYSSLQFPPRILYVATDHAENLNFWESVRPQGRKLISSHNQSAVTT